MSIATIGVVGLSTFTPYIPIGLSPIQANAVEAISVTEDSSTKKTIESSQLRVWMQSSGRYGLQLKNSGATVFYGNDSANANIIRSGSHPTGFPSGFASMSVKSFVVNGNVIEQTRTDGVFDYIFRISIVNATSQGAYMKAEMEMKNLTSSYQNVGLSFNIDTQVNGNDQSPFRIVPNGWEAFHNGVQVTAYYQNVFNTTNADSIYLGVYNNQYPMGVNSFYEGQVIYPGDSGAGFYYNLKSVAPYQSRKESWIMGLGPKNANPSFSMSSPVDNNTYYRGQSFNIAGTAQDADVGDLLTMKWSVDGGTENTLTTMVANGSSQPFNYAYTLPNNLAEGWHTLQVWAMDDKGGVSNSNTRNFYVNNFTAPGIPTFPNVTDNSFDVSFDKRGNVASTTYEVNKVHSGTTVSLGTNTSFKESGLTPNTRYQYKVRAKNTSNVYTEYSSVGSIYTLAKQPTAGSYDASVNGSVSLGWLANGNPSGTTYHYEVRNTVDNSVVKSGDTTNTSVTITGIPTDAPYNLYVRAVNGDRVNTPDTLIGSMLQDTLAPSMTITTNTASWTNGTVQINVKAMDGGTGVKRIKLPNGNYVTSSTATYTASTNGTYVFESEDNVGNKRTQSINVTNIDKEAPNVPNVSANSNWTNASSVPVTLTTGNDNGTSGVNRMEYSLSGSSTKDWTTYTGAIAITAEGTTTVKARTIDNAGNISPVATTNVNIDRGVPSPPVVNSNGYSSGTWATNNLTFIASKNNEGLSESKVQVKQDNGNWMDYSKDIKIEKEGASTLSFRVIDEAGNISQSVSYVVNLDKGNPSLTGSLSTTEWTKGDVVINLNALDSVSGVKQIFLPNGKAVTASSASLTVSSNGIYSFMVEDHAGRKTTLPITVSNIDKENPYTPTVVASEEWSTTNVPVSLSHNGDKGDSGVERVEYKLSGATTKEWSTYSSTFSLSNEGQTSIQSRVIDKAGNVSEVSTKVVKIDKTVPIVNATINPSTWSKNTASIQVTATDSVSGVKRIQLPDGNWNASSTATFTVIRNGTFEFLVEDNAGNQTRKTVVVNNLDLLAPNLNLNASKTDWTNKDIVLSASASDGESGVDKIQLPNNQWVTGTEASYTIQENGVYPFTAMDKVGNLFTKSITIANIDKKVPSLTLSQNIVEYTNKEVTINAVALDNESGIKRIQVPNGNWVTGGVSSYTVNKNGTYTFQTEDVAGNLTTKTITVSNIAPEYASELVSENIPNIMEAGESYPVTIKVKNLGKEVWNQANFIQLAGVGDSDPFAEVKHSLNNQEVRFNETATFTFTMKAPNVPGSYKTDWAMRQNDPSLSGHWYPTILDKTVTVRDTTAPSLRLEASSTDWMNGNVIITGKASDSGSGVKRIKNQDGVWTTGSSVSYTAKANGTYSFIVEDNAGNLITESITLSNIDKTAPVLTIHPDVTDWTKDEITLTAEATDVGSGVKRIKLPNGTWVNGSTTSYVISENGTYTFVVEDNVGIATSKSITINNVDKTAPTAPVISAVTDWTKDTPVSVTIKAGTDSQAGVKGVEYKLEGATNQGWAMYTSSFTLLNEGETKITARTIDNLGQLSAQVVANVKIDRSNPINTSITIKKTY